MVNIERLTTKYTGQPVDIDALITARRDGGLAAALVAAIEHTVNALDHTEGELTRLVEWITDSTSRVSRAITAETTEQAPRLNPLGELQSHAPRFDALIAIRDDRIAHLRVLVGLWQQLSGTTSSVE